MLEKDKNYTISLLKFIFCMVIVAFHSYHWASTEDVLFKYGSICVEFFFLVSGFLLAKSAVKNIESTSIPFDTLKFMFKKFKNLFPYVGIAFLLCIVIMILGNSIEIVKIVKSGFEILMLNMFTYPKLGINGFTWYISSMLFAMLLLYPLIKKFKSSYFYIIAPIIFIFLLCYMSHTFSSLKAPFEWTGLMTYKGNLRAIMEVCLGTIIFAFIEYIKQFDFKKWFRISLTIFEILGYGLVIFVFTYTTRYDYIILFILATLVCISFSKVTYLNSILSNKFVNYLGEISLSIYIFQGCAILIMKQFIHVESYYIGMIIYISISLLFGIVFQMIIKKLKNIKFKNFIINSA